MACYQKEHVVLMISMSMMISSNVVFIQAVACKALITLFVNRTSIPVVFEDFNILLFKVTKGYLRSRQKNGRKYNVKCKKDNVYIEIGLNVKGHILENEKM